MMDIDLSCNSALRYIMEKDDSSSSNSHEKLFSPSSPPSLKKQANISTIESSAGHDSLMMKEPPSSSSKDAGYGDDVIRQDDDDDVSAGSFSAEGGDNKKSSADVASAAAAAPSNNNNNKAAGNVANMSFPSKLYEMLEDAEREGFDHIVSWLPCGTGLKVHSQEKFVNEGIMSRYFKQTRYKSFQKQLNLYKFQRTADGARKGSYSHELFQRGEREQCKLITRAKLNQSPRKISSSNNAVATTQGMFQNRDHLLLSSIQGSAAPISSRPMINSQKNQSIQGLAPEDLLFGALGGIGGIHNPQQQQQLIGGMNLFSSSDDSNNIPPAALSAASALPSLPSSNILSNMPATTTIASNNNLAAMVTWQGNPNVADDIVDEIILTFGNGMNPNNTF